MASDSDGGMGQVAEAAGHRGGWVATTISTLAFAFSGASFYMSALQQADLDVYVPPVVQYARDGGGEIDVFALPITISNNGANTGTVLAMELKVEPTAADAETRSKVFYSAFVGEHPRQPDAMNKTFAPISVPGRASYSETLRFYPRGEPLPKVVSTSGEYRFTLTLMVAEPVNPSWIDTLFKVKGPAPLEFTRTIPYISEQHLGFRRGTISMHAKDWKPTASGGK